MLAVLEENRIMLDLLMFNHILLKAIHFETSSKSWDNLEDVN